MSGVLMIAFHYPPATGSGYLRTLKFSKYLPIYGWRPVVLTVRQGVYPARDESMLREIPEGVEVHRTCCVDSRRTLSVRGKHLAALTVPDGYLSWLPFAVIRGLRLIRDRRIRAVYSTSPVPTAHLVALALRKLSDVGWVADFRDPWVEQTPEAESTALRLRVESGLESLVVRHADVVTATTDRLRRELLERHADADAARFRVITNGYDEDDFDWLDASAPPRPERFDLVHAGLLNASYRSPEPLLRATRDLLESGRLRRGEVTLRFLGNDPYTASGRLASLVRSYGLEDSVEIPGFLPYKECLRLLSRSAVLVLIQAGEDTRGLVPAKAFEYIRLGRPILALTPEGATADLVREAGAGCVVDPQDESAIGRAIVDLQAAFRAGGLRASPDEAVLRRYGRRQLTGQLASVLGRAAADAAAGAA